MTEIAQLSQTGSMESLTVGLVAETYSVTVRTLHHYDEVGLLHPSERTHAGCRIYTPDDPMRLSTIVVYRRLDFLLEEIGELLDAEGVDAIDHRLEAEMADQPATTEDFESDLGAAVRTGTPTDGDEAAELAERHHASIDQHYDCDHAFQVCLAQIYLSDEHFTVHYEEISPGTTQWLHDAMVANAARHGA